MNKTWLAVKEERIAPGREGQGLSVRERKCLKLRVEKFC